MRNSCYPHSISNKICWHHRSAVAISYIAILAWHFSDTLCILFFINAWSATKEVNIVFISQFLIINENTNDVLRFFLLILLESINKKILFGFSLCTIISWFILTDRFPSIIILLNNLWQDFNIVHPSPIRLLIHRLLFMCVCLGTTFWQQF